jgi:hypothetical protein
MDLPSQILPDQGSIVQPHTRCWEQARVYVLKNVFSVRMRSFLLRKGTALQGLLYK